MESFAALFTFDITILSVTDCLLRIGCAFVAGFIMGIEREIHQHPAGLRTIIMITVSSALLMILSIAVAVGSKSGDPARIAAQVVSGIGFLGGGAILRQGLNIRGLTSASIIWAAAAMGLALGAGLFFAAAFTMIVYIVTLVLLEKLEVHIFPAEQRKILELEFDDTDHDVSALRTQLTEKGIMIYNTDAACDYAANTMRVSFGVEIPKKIDFAALVSQIKSTSGTLRAVNLHG